MEWRDNLHKTIRHFLKDLPLIVVDCLDAAYLAGLEAAQKCTMCEAPFESHHHKHITKKGIFHTSCYKKIMRP